MSGFTSRKSGPAFPCDEKHDDGSHYMSHPGMFLRDYFASVPITEYNFPTVEDAANFLGVEPPENDDIQGVFELSAKVEARIRYMRADAMLVERDK